MSTKKSTPASTGSKPAKPAIPTKSDLKAVVESDCGDFPCHLRLYVAGETPRSRAAIDNLQKLCREELGGKVHLEVIDLRKNPALARGDQIVAVPTLVRHLPPPLKRIIGDLSNVERVLVGLDLREDADKAQKNG